MYVAFAGAVIASFDSVIEETVYTIAVVLIIFSGIDTALCGDTMCATRTIVKGEAFDVVAEFAERCGSSSAGETGTDDDDIEAEFVIGRYEGYRGFIFFPFVGDGAWRNFTI